MTPEQQDLRATQLDAKAADIERNGFPEGQRVRVIATGRIGTVTNVTNMEGFRHVLLDKRPRQHKVVSMILRVSQLERL